MQGSSPLAFQGANNFGAIFADMLAPYSKEMNTKISAIAKAQDILLHQGVYASVLGPQLETKAHEVFVKEFEVYKTMLNPIKVDTAVSGVLFYSPSGIESYLEENSTEKVAFCIGETTAVAARKYFDKVEVANMPDVESVLALVNTYFSK